MRKILAICLALSASGPGYAQPGQCPRPDSSSRLTFAEGSVAMRTGLAVNPDGAGPSYTPGDHGYTYISNGVNLHSGGRRIACSEAGNSARCRRDWRLAEAGGFGLGTPEFCVYAMEVEPVTPGAALVNCERPGRSLVGGGKGRPRSGAPIPTVARGTVAPYSSTTSLRHMVDGSARYVDSAAIPALVVPTGRPELVGAIAWVRFGSHSGFAIVGDTGPAFGEGSVALHQLLRSGRVGPVQPVGPLPLELRCTAGETRLRPPFQSRPDISGDRCRPGVRPRGASDIRAYSGIDRGVDSVILARVKPPMRGRTITEALTTHLLESTARAAGYTPEWLAAMADCLP